MSVLFWLTDEQWAAMEPCLPRGQPDAKRVDDRRVSQACFMFSRPAPMVRLPGSLRPVHDRLQPVQSVVPAAVLGRPAGGAGGVRRGRQEYRRRFHLRQGAALGLRGKRGGAGERPLARRPDHQGSRAHRRRRTPLHADPDTRQRLRRDRRPWGQVQGKFNSTHPWMRYGAQVSSSCRRFRRDLGLKRSERRLSRPDQQ